MLSFKPQNAKGKTGGQWTLAEAAAKCAVPVSEPKQNGWRLIVIRDADGVRVYTRTGKEYTAQLPPRIKADLARLPVDTTLDGEIVDLEGQDVTCVTNVFGSSKAKPTQEQLDKLTYVAFDLIRMGGVDCTKNKLAERRHALDRLLDGIGADPELVQLIPQGAATEAVYDLLVENGYEGVVVKDLNAPYAAGKRGHGWFKIKATCTVDAVITALPLDGKGQFEGQVGRAVVSQYMAGKLVERAKVNMKFPHERREATDFPERYLGRVLEVKIYGTHEDDDGTISWQHPTPMRWREDKAAEECVYNDGE